MRYYFVGLLLLVSCHKETKIDDQSHFADQSLIDNATKKQTEIHTASTVTEAPTHEVTETFYPPEEVSVPAVDGGTPVVIEKPGALKSRTTIDRGPVVSTKAIDTQQSVVKQVETKKDVIKDDHKKEETKLTVGPRLKFYIFLLVAIIVVLFLLYKFLLPKIPFLH